MVHPSADNFWRLGLVWRAESFYLGVYRAMRVFVAAALLFAAVAVTTLGGPGTGDREHLLSGDTSAKREHIL